jgi:hypothetical protein
MLAVPAARKTVQLAEFSPDILRGPKTADLRNARSVGRKLSRRISIGREDSDSVRATPQKERSERFEEIGKLVEEKFGAEGQDADCDRRRGSGVGLASRRGSPGQEGYEI